MCFHRLNRLVWLVAAAVFSQFAPPAIAAAARSIPPIEVDTKDAKLTKIIVIAGAARATNDVHDYLNGAAVLVKTLSQTRGVFPVLVRDGWPKNEALFERAKAIVYYGDGGEGHPLCTSNHLPVLLKLAKSGVGLVHLHTGADYPSEHSGVSTALQGGFYDRHLNCRPAWPTTFKDFRKLEVLHGVKEFSYLDSWPLGPILFSEKKGFTAALSVMQTFESGDPTKKSNRFALPEDVAWTFERRDGGRSFSFLGGHLLESWSDEGFRRVVANGVLWAAKIDVPVNGAAVTLPAAELPEKKYRPSTPAGKAAVKK